MPGINDLSPPPSPCRSESPPVCIDLTSPTVPKHSTPTKTDFPSLTASSISPIHQSLPSPPPPCSPPTIEETDHVTARSESSCEDADNSDPRAVGGKDLPGLKQEFLDVETLIKEQNCDTPLKTVFVCCDGGLKKVVERDGVLCLERRRNKKTVFLPLEEQPNKDSVLILHRYYQKHSLSASYEKRTSWLTKDCVPSGSNYVACVEYKGDFPGSVPHKKSENNNRNYVRLRPDVARDIKERVKTSKPSEIYETMRFKVAETGDTADAPRTHKLQRDKERTMQRWQ